MNSCHDRGESCYPFLLVSTSYPPLKGGPRTYLGTDLALTKAAYVAVRVLPSFSRCGIASKRKG